MKDKNEVLDAINNELNIINYKKEKEQEKLEKKQQEKEEDETLSSSEEDNDEDDVLTSSEVSEEDSLEENIDNDKKDSDENNDKDEDEDKNVFGNLDVNNLENKDPNSLLGMILQQKKDLDDLKQDRLKYSNDLEKAKEIENSVVSVAQKKIIDPFSENEDFPYKDETDDDEKEENEEVKQDSADNSEEDDKKNDIVINEIDEPSDPHKLLTSNEIDTTVTFIDPEDKDEEKEKMEHRFKVVETPLGIFTILRHDGKNVVLLDANSEQIQISIEDFNNLHPFEVEDEELSNVISFKNAKKEGEETNEEISMLNEEDEDEEEENIDEEENTDENEEENSEEDFGSMFGESKKTSDVLDAKNDSEIKNTNFENILFEETKLIKSDNNDNAFDIDNNNNDTTGINELNEVEDKNNNVVSNNLIDLNKKNYTVNKNNHKQNQNKKIKHKNENFDILKEIRAEFSKNKLSETNRDKKRGKAKCSFLTGKTKQLAFKSNDSKAVQSPSHLNEIRKTNPINNIKYMESKKKKTLHGSGRKKTEITQVCDIAPRIGYLSAYSQIPNFKIRDKKYLTIKDGKYVLLKLEGKLYSSILKIKLNNKNNIKESRQLLSIINNNSKYFEILNQINFYFKILDEEIIMLKNKSNRKFMEACKNEAEDEELELDEQMVDEDMDEDMDDEDDMDDDEDDDMIEDDDEDDMDDDEEEDDDEDEDIDDDDDMDDDEDDMEEEDDDDDEEIDEDDMDEDDEEMDDKEEVVVEEKTDNGVPFSIKMNGVNYSGILYPDTDQAKQEDSDFDVVQMNNEVEVKEDEEEAEEDDREDYLLEEDDIDKLEFKDELKAESIIRAKARICNETINIKFVKPSERSVKQAKLEMRRKNLAGAWNSLIRGSKRVD